MIVIKLLSSNKAALKMDKRNKHKKDRIEHIMFDVSWILESIVKFKLNSLIIRINHLWLIHIAVEPEEVWGYNDWIDWCQGHIRRWETPTGFCLWAHNKSKLAVLRRADQRIGLVYGSFDSWHNAKARPARKDHHLHHSSAVQRGLLQVR